MRQHPCCFLRHGVWLGGVDRHSLMDFRPKRTPSVVVAVILAAAAVVTVVVIATQVAVSFLLFKLAESADENDDDA